MSKSSPVSFPDLPIEVVYRVFILLDLNELHTISCLNKTCYAIYKQHLELEFTLKAAGVVNGSRLVDSAEKLRALKRREERWRVLDMSRSATVKIPHSASNLYDLSAGFYVLGGVSGNSFFDYYAKKTKFVAFADLSNYEGEVDGEPEVSEPAGDGEEELDSKKTGGSQWGIVQADKESVIVDFGLCIEEHDLIAMVEVTPSSGGSPIKLHLHQFSTGGPHPAASKPIIDLGMTHSTWGKLSLMAEVAGPYLLLLLNWDKHNDEPAGGARDKLLLIDWNSGVTLVEEQSPCDVWNGLVFITPLTFILTDMERRCLDVIHIPQNLPKPSTHTGDVEATQQPRSSFIRIMSFMLPEPVPEFFYYTIACRADPNPFGTQPDGSVSIGTEKRRRALFTNDPGKALLIFRLMLTRRPGLIRFSFVVHRSSILRFVHEAAPWLLTDSPPPEETSNPVSLHWDDWGPSSTRWVYDEAFHTPWITTTAGQREVFMRGSPGEIVVRDYNPVNIRRAIWEVENEVFDELGGRRKLIMESEPLLPWRFAFKDNGSSSLPCIEVETEEQYDYDGVLMDENHLLGLERAEDSFQLATFDVFTF